MKKWRIGSIVIVIAFIAIFIYAKQESLIVTRYTISAKSLPNEMDGLKIVQLSDLHQAQFGENQQQLVAEVKAEKPDLIFITGDLVDRYAYDLQKGLAGIEQLVKIAPVYFVFGNHEISINDMPNITRALEAKGVHVLLNDMETFTKNGATIELIGIDDPLNGQTSEVMLEEAMKHSHAAHYRILLAHRPEFYDAYEAANVNITFNGHAHGGQIRIPGIGGLIDHDYHLFPDHIEGIEQVGDMTQVISRGLGNSRLPIRLFNRPEIVSVTLNQK